MSSNPSTPLAAAPAAAAPSSAGPARALRQRDLQQSSLGFFVGGSDCVRFSDHPDPEQCRAPLCGAVCLYAARVDADNLDTAFDAGGKVSIGLTATTIVSQWTWSATLLQSSTVASKVSQGRNTPNMSHIEKGTIFTVCTYPSCEAS